MILICLDMKMFYLFLFLRNLFRHFHFKTMDQFLDRLFCNHIFRQAGFFPSFAVTGLYSFFECLCQCCLADFVIGVHPHIFVQQIDPLSTMLWSIVSSFDLYVSKPCQQSAAVFFMLYMIALFTEFTVPDCLLNTFEDLLIQTATKL